MLILSLKSLGRRRFTVALTIAAMAISVALVLGVERLRDDARKGFTDTITGIDAIVAARGDDLQILLATVFGIGSTSNSMTWKSYEEIAALPEVDWAVPVASGGAYEGFSLIGTTPAYFERFRYGRDRALAFSKGRAFGDKVGAVIGAEVAERLSYGVGTVIANTYRGSNVSLDAYISTPLSVCGILAQTGTPIDRMVFVPIKGFAVINAYLGTPAADPPSNLEAGRFEAPAVQNADDARNAVQEMAGSRINAIYISLVSPEAVPLFKRAVANYGAEPLTTVLPAAALLRLWSISSVAELALRVVAIAVVVTALLTMVVMLSATLDARRREFAILRSVGATPAHLTRLVLMEAAFVSLAGLGLGLVLLAIAAAIAGPFLSGGVGFTVSLLPTSAREYATLAVIALAAITASFIPAWRVFRHTLADGLNIRL